MPGKSVEELVAENDATMKRLQEKRDKINALAVKEVNQQEQVAAEYHAAQLAEEERRLDAELEFQQSRVGITNIREGAPDTAEEAAAKAAAADAAKADPKASEKGN